LALSHHEELTGALTSSRDMWVWWGDDPDAILLLRSRRQAWMRQHDSQQRG
jgi:hypothetical protein